MPLSLTLDESIRALARADTRPDGGQCQVLPYFAVQDLARGLGRSPGNGKGHPHSKAMARVELAALELGILPERYQRNSTTYSFTEQIRLLTSRVALIGLGGLGGHALEILARTGVGHICAADGDEFQPSNLNRQLLCTRRSISGYKAAAAAARVQQVNPAVDFEPVAAYLDEELMERFLVGADLAVDALGGLKDRPALLHQAARAGIPLVTAAVAGQAGYVATVLPGAKGPSDIFGADSEAAENTLGTPAPAVVAAAALMSAEALNILCGREPRLAGAMLVFDLEGMSFERVSL
ncbi:MAG: ThiF family adenylyltransferase [Proteobacteria bacterium]|nr:ThiF family adenylyltransferase [Pseudomonadota bacterium]